MVKKLMNNYKELIECYIKDYKKGCYDDKANYINAISTESSKIKDTLKCLYDYNAITSETYSKTLNDCIYYTLKAYKELK